jgi:hypothetical protein
MCEFPNLLVQAVLVTNQMYAGSLGADALAAAAIGFTVRCSALQRCHACMLGRMPPPALHH